MIEVKPDKVTVADRIRSLSDEGLNTFLFQFKVNVCALFIQNGEKGLLGAKEQLKLLQTESDIADVKYTEFSAALFEAIRELGKRSK